MNINVKDQKIEDVFGNTVYFIDFYQREYKWTSLHVETLLDDIFYKFDTDYKAELKADTSTIDEKFSWYYLNTYVTHTQKGRKYIVDGQQRFTTLTLILLKLYNLAKSQNLSPARIDYVKKKIFDAGPDGYSFWMGAINRDKALEDLLKNGKKTISDFNKDISISNVYKNYDFIDKYLDGKLKTQHLVDSFILYFSRKIILVEIQIPESNDVAMVFEVINARGEKLKPYEILKGELLGQIEKEYLEEYLKIWNKGIKTLQDGASEPDNFVEAFFKTLLRSRYTSTTTEFKEFENKDYHKTIFSKKLDNVIRLKRNPKRVKEFIENDFAYYVEKYYSLNRQTNEQSQFPYIFFNYLNKLGSQYNLYLSSLKIKDEQYIDKIKLLSKLIDRNFSLLQILDCYNSNKFADSVKNLTLSIRDGDLDAIKELFDQDLLNTINTVRNTNLNSPFYYPFFKETGFRNQTFIRYFFARIERFIALETKQHIDSFKNLVQNSGRVNGYHIEHILSNNEYNMKIFESEEEFIRERIRLGALLLINSSVNVSSGNEEYQNKLKTYSHETIWAKTLTEDFYHKNPNFKSFSEKYNLDFKHIKEFNKEAIENRQKLLFDIVKIIWADNDNVQY
jgi:uncharacterized protein with ParB-like and HNH nuclease domain